VPTLDDDLLDQMRTECDLPADRVVERHFDEDKRSPRELFGALVRHPGDPTAARPGAVADYLAEQPPWPSWARPHLVEQGQGLFEQWGPQILSNLLFASLPAAYAAANGVQVLHLTARLATDPRRRLLETTQMTVDAMTVGGLAVGATGYRTARRVRLMHAAVRYLIAHDPLVAHTCDENVPERWCPDWGAPINQEDLVGTLLTFTVVVLDALHRSGVRVSPEDAEAYLHSWSLVGHLLGIRPDLLPLDVATGRAAWATITRRQYASSVAGRYMAAALERLAAGQMRPRLLAGLPRTTTRHLLGDDVGDLLGLPPANWTRVLFGPARRLMAVLSLGDQHDRLLRAATSYLNRRMVAGFLAMERGGDRAAFSVPHRLADAWSIPEAGG
jgi:hypothetical protein